MSMARAFKDRGSLFVCRLCRHRLSRTTQPADRALGMSPKSALSAPYHVGKRLLCSTPVLRNDGDKDDAPKPGAFPSRFPGLGGGGFGSFAAGAKAAPKAGIELLPHEQAARKNMAPAPKPPPSSASPKSTPFRRAPIDPDQAARSNEVLSKIFSEKSSPRRSNQQDAWATRDTWGESGLPSPPRPERRSSPAQADRSSGSERGMFSRREAQIQTSDRDRERHLERQGSNQRDAGRTPQPQNQRSESPKEDPFAAMQRLRQGESRTRAGSAKKLGASGTSDDAFWSELDNRVQGFKSPQPTEQEPSGLDEPSEEAKIETSRRTYSSRYESVDPQDDDRSKKDKSRRKEKGRGRGRQGGDEEFDEDVVLRWEEKQARKAKKSRSKDVAEETQAAATPIFLPEYISITGLAQAIGEKKDKFLADMEEMGFENLTADTILTGDTAALVVMEYGFEPTVDTGLQRDLRPRPVPEDVSSLPSRPPIVTIMGHVDHGKTTLLDWLRKSSVAAQEHGGITQHIGAFVVKMSSGKAITFLDTPGHAAFLSMRQRGANVTDIVVLVVAADDSVKPQTLEALKHATAARVPIIVAISKIDKEDARVDQVKADLSRHGVEIEDYGGDVQVVGVSGRTGQGMDDLEENIVTLSEVLDVRAESDGLAEGWLLESSVKVDGKVATVLIKRGTLRTGDLIVAGKTWARVRLLRNEAGIEVGEAGPGTPVEILGWRDLPEAGEQVLQALDEETAKTATEYRQEMSDREQDSAQLAAQEQRQRDKAAADALAESADPDAKDETPAEPSIRYQNVVIRADVAGSVEAVSAAILELGNNEVEPKVLRSQAGQVSESDVDHAAASGSIIINFGSSILPHIKQRAEEAKVQILDHSVIYHLVDDAKSTLSHLLAPTVVTRVLGEAEILQVFAINIKRKQFQNIAGCRVRNGTIKRGSLVKLLRKGKVVFEGKFETLKQGKKDASEVGKGSECGLSLEGFEDFQVDDQIQTYELIEEKRKL